jgi:hypothetical protein
VSDHTEPMPIPSWMLIDAVRYATGRCTYQVGTTCDWLCAHWPRLPEHARSIIQRDVEEAFARDDRDRANGSQYKALGHDCDRRDWERVRALWAAPEARGDGREERG